MYGRNFPSLHYPSNRPFASLTCGFRTQSTSQHNPPLHIGCLDPSGGSGRHRGEIQPALAGFDIRYVGDPFLIGAEGAEVALQEVLCDWHVVFAVGGYWLEFASGN